MTPDAKRLVREFGPLFGAYIVVRAVFMLDGPTEVKVALVITAVMLVLSCFGAFDAE